MAVDRRLNLQKQPSEEFDIDIDFSNATPLASMNLVSATASAIKWPRKIPNDQSVATTQILRSSTGVVLSDPDNCSCGQIVRFRLYGGISDYEYKITILANFDDGSRLEEDLFLRVREE
ncbi:hypothetical protein EBU71_09565 [bacterium]|nr:hypothetical protein [Candidatus Elulimicrobium humile]